MTGKNTKCLEIRLIIVKKTHAKESFYNNLDIIISDVQNNDKRKFRKVIRHFVKSNSSASSVPHLCSK